MPEDNRRRIFASFDISYVTKRYIKKNDTAYEAIVALQSCRQEDSVFLECYCAINDIIQFDRNRKKLTGGATLHSENTPPANRQRTEGEQQLRS